MITKINILILTLALTSAASAAVPVIAEGVFLEEAEGLIMLDTQTDTWQFIPEEAVEITADKSFPAGQPLAMLPCSVLEQMAKLAGEEPKLQVQLWAIFTKYKEVNYLFSVYFMPIAEETTPVEEPAQQPAEEPDTEKPGQNQGSGSIIPENILTQIRSTETPDLKRFEQIAVVTGDKNMIGRTGYLIEQNGQRVFHPDGFGRNVNEKAFVLLPNQMRAQAEERMNMTPGKQRYTISGLVTTYKGKNYMLLRRAQRTFTNGNFTR